MSFLISRVPPAHSFFQKTSILENTAKSLPTYFLTLTKKINNLLRVLTYLQDSGTVPIHYDPHPLKGNYSSFMECHIESDFLLIWIDEKSNQIRLTRLGTHAELFKK